PADLSRGASLRYLPPTHPGVPDRTARVARTNPSPQPGPARRTRGVDRSTRPPGRVRRWAGIVPGVAGVAADAGGARAHRRPVAPRRPNHAGWGAEGRGAPSGRAGPRQRAPA